VVVMAKKSVKKRTQAKKSTKKSIKPEYYFLMIDGSTLKSLHELADALHHMSDDVFYYHVTSERNDFSSWVRDVFSEKNLAEELALVRNKLESQVAVLRHLLKKVGK
jgi:predicted transcriptional regulator